MAEVTFDLDDVEHGTRSGYVLAGAAALAVTAEIRRLRALNQHLAGALERATTGQVDPVSLRLGLAPIDTGDQPPPDLDEMRRLIAARREHGCVAASIWLHDLEWILDHHGGELGQ